MNKCKNRRRRKSSTSKKSGDERNDSICMSRQLNNKKQAKVKKKLRNSLLKKRVERHMLVKPNIATLPMPSFSDLEKMFDDSEAIDVSNPEFGTSSMNIPTIKNNMLLEENTSNSKPNRYNHTDVITIDTQLNVNNSVDTNLNIPIKYENSVDTVNIVYTKPNFSCNEIIIIDDEDSSVKLAQGRKRDRSEQNDLVQKIDISNKEKVHKTRKLSSKKCEARECDNEDCDSDVTVIYDIEAPVRKSPAPSSFSPLPSTSTDNAIILENDKILMQSLYDAESNFTKETQEAQRSKITVTDTKGIHITEVSEITIIDDEGSNENSKETISNFKKGLHNAQVSEITVIDVDESNDKSRVTLSNFTKPTHSTEVSEVTVIDDNESNKNSVPNNGTDLKLELHSHSIEDLSITSPTSIEIDVDALISENETILTKYKTVENLPAVINVKPKGNNNQTVNTDNIIQNLSISCDTNQSTPVVLQRSFNIDLGAPMATIPRPIHNRQLINSPRNSNLTHVMVTDSPDRISNSSEVICPICFENLRSNVESASTSCGHIFCMACIKRALKSARKCPTCRKTLKASGYHRLFL